MWFYCTTNVVEWIILVRFQVVGRDAHQLGSGSQRSGNGGRRNAGGGGDPVQGLGEEGERPGGGGAGDGVDAGEREYSGQLHAAAELAGERVLVGGRRGAGEEHSRSKSRGVESDGHAVASEGGDNGGLVAQSPESGRRMG